MFEKIKQSFRSHPWQNSVLIVLVIAVGVMAFFIFSGKITFNGNNKVVFFPGQAKDYYIPDTQKDTTTLPKTATTVSTTAMVENLYNYGSHDNNISTGLRKSTTTSYKSGLLGRANAAIRSYPVIYYYDVTKNPGIVEINGLTGEQKTILTEKFPITSLDFSEANQALVYTVASNNDTGNENGSTKIYYLNTDKLVTIWDNVAKGVYADPSWSPNGKYIKGTSEASKNPSPSVYKEMSLSVYDVEKNQTVVNPCSNASICDGKWGDDNKTLVTVLDSAKGNPAWYNNQFMTIDAITGESQVINDGYQNANAEDARWLGYVQLINNRLFGLVHIPRDVNTSNYNNAGWLYTYDLGKKEAKSFKDQMGMNTYYRFLISKNGSKMVYEDQNDKKIKILNTDTGEIKTLDKTFNTYLTPEGWNGNEDNFISIAYNKFYNVNLTTGDVTLITK